jgi:undecaprenyl-diphosphatase
VPLDDRLEDAQEPRVFRPRRHSATEQFAERVAGLHPVLAGVVAAVIGYLLLVAATIAVGAVLVELVLPGSVNHADNAVNRWFADGRTPLETDLSWVGSHLAESVTVIAVGVGVAILMLVRHHVLAAIFIAVAIAVEGVTYLGTTLVIDRPRPPVARLDNLGPGASYPSGHTAASVAVYGAIAVIVCAYVQSRAARRAAIALAIVAPLCVAIARIYRGMHHPIDVILGALMGVGCLAVGLLVARVVGVAIEHRRVEASQ